MQLTDARWSEKWSKTKFRLAPSLDDFSAALLRRSEALRFGTDDEPGSSLWLASLSEAMGEHFREDMSVLDYGCGAGRSARFLAQRLATFAYYGLEKRGSVVRHGEMAIEAASDLFGADARMTFDFIGGRIEAAALAGADVAVLGSVFTHVDFDEMRRILTKFGPILDRGGKVVFSIFTSDEHLLEKPGLYGFEDCYNRTWFTTKQLRQLCEDRGWMLDERESFLAQEVNLHRIFALTARN
jgi:SAM-dependent methyltransferase